MRDRKLASRYARALLGAIPDAQARETTDRFLASLAEAIQSSESLRAALFDPAVPRPVRTKALQSLSGAAGLPDLEAKFLTLLVERNRLIALPSIAHVFHEMHEAAAGIVPAEVTSAAPLTDDLRARIEAALEKASGARVRLVCSVDPGILGGAVARVGTFVFDGSLRTQLSRLRKHMTQDETAREAR
jgi:F-type H+-transporting ATPase subunit delta